jgi:hypothetical protein
MPGIAVKTPLRRGATAAVAAVLLAAAAAGAQECPAHPAPSADLTGDAVRYLADDALEGRLAGSAGERCAADYVAVEFARLGLLPAGDEGTWFQAVPLASATNPHAPYGTGRNVVGLLPGADPALHAEVVIVGAHHDHLGRGEVSSLAPEQRGAIHNGADDNASGVAAMLAIADALRSGARPARSIVFVAFTGEELGLLGSAHYASRPAAALERTLAMLNLDMVGRLGDGPLVVYGTGTAAELEGIVVAAAAAEGIGVRHHPDGYGPSDHTSFYARDVPVLHFFTNVHDDYHRPSDDWELLDLEGVRRVGALATRIVREIADRPLALTLQRGAGTPPRAAAAGPGYGAYLGTIPDFAPVEHGVRLSGVRQGSPADEAGLLAGDVIVAMDDDVIADLYAYTDALRSRAPGRRVLVTVLREGERLVLPALLGSRPQEP